MLTILNILITTTLPIVLMAGLGAALDRFKRIDTKSVSGIVIYLASPALAFDGLARSSIGGGEIGMLILFSMLLFAATALLGWLITRLTDMDRLTASAFVLPTVLLNGVNYGVPLNQFAFGEAGLERALFLGVIGGFYAYTLGIFIASWGEASARQGLVNVIRVPAPYAAILGLMVNLLHWPVPAMVYQITEVMADMAIPLMLVMLGIQLSRVNLQAQWRLMVGASLFRLLGGAVLGFLLAWLLGLEGITRQVAIVQSAVPAAVISGILATEFNSDAELVSSIIFLSTLLSLITIPVVIYFVR